jgi:CubicO group peptidase (beta-lactamase class C family)
MKDGQLVYEKGFGLADMDHQVALSPDSIFDIASMAKQFTAAAIALLVDEQMIDVQEDIREYLPELPDYGVPITVHDLIHHQSGIRDYSVLAYLTGTLGDQSLNNAGIVRLLARQKALNFPPGERFIYSNSNYVLLAEILERVTGESFPEFVRAKIFEPLSMSNTSLRGSSRTDRTNVAIGYRASADGGYTPEYDNIATYGDGRLLSSIKDIAVWDQNLYQGTVGGKSLIDRMRARGILESGLGSEYGYGLQFSHYRGLPVEHHGGTTNGFRAQLMRFPTEHVSIAVFCNVTTASADRLSLQMADIVLEDVLLPRDPSHFATQVRINPETFDAYVGRYSVPEDGGSYVMTVSREGDRYFVRRPGTPPIEMFASSDSDFFTPVSPARFEFHRSNAGTVTGVTITQPSGTKEGSPTSSYPPPSEIDLRRLVGRYSSDELLVSYEISMIDGRLVAVGPAGRLPLTARGEGRFDFPGDGEISFFGEAGEPAGLSLSMTRARDIAFRRVD